MGGPLDVSVTGMPSYDYASNMLTNPSALILISVVIVIFYLIFAALGALTDGGDNKAESNIGSMVFLEVLLWATFIIVLFINGVVYFLGYDITASLKNIFDETPQIDINIDQPPTNSVSKNSTSSGSGGKSQVFHIPGNDYVYEDAKALCKAYGAKLATYDQVESAYEKGGEWCSFGWSDDQMALYPTQKKTYQELQNIEGHEHDCGRPGINGGYIANPKVRFGVNCYGKKPKITSLEREIMNNQTKYPKTMKDMAQEKRSKYWEDQLDNIIISPFNYDSWNKV
jgi:hypothetical protein